MHDSAYELMRGFVGAYVHPPCTVADVGAFDMNGCFRPLFGECEYTGLDVREGPNVDRVVQAYDFGEDRFDVVVSGQAMEHVADLRAWAGAIRRICRPGGLICVVAPHTWHEHCRPDYWRILPDGMRWAFEGVTVIDCRIASEADTLLVAREP